MGNQTKSEFTTRPATAHEHASILKVLSEASLPTEDVSVGMMQDFLVCESSGDGGDPNLVGVVGLEAYDDVGLLRSLAVSEHVRGHGLGGRLVSAIEEHAKSRGVRTMYLLTTTAEPFFTARGYEVAQRDEAPEAIRSTQEFAGLCPATAAFLAKAL